MSATTSLESLREALAGEHSQLESWVRESFAAMDALHGELSDWQRDLTRQQALLDQRRAALGERAQASEHQYADEVNAAFTSELQELRRMIERQASLLERLCDAAEVGSPLSDGDAQDETLDAGDGAAELLRRASTRDASRRPT